MSDTILSIHGLQVLLTKGDEGLVESKIDSEVYESGNRRIAFKIDTEGVVSYSTDNWLKLLKNEEFYVKTASERQKENTLMMVNTRRKYYI